MEPMLLAVVGLLVFVFGAWLLARPRRPHEPRRAVVGGVVVALGILLVLAAFWSAGELRSESISDVTPLAGTPES